MQTLLTAAENFGFELNDAELQAASKRVKEADHNQMITPPLADDISTLWHAQPLQNAWNKRNEFWILDGAKYYFENANRFATEGFCPTEGQCFRWLNWVRGLLSPIWP